jgi:PAS domain S-box-containing protein
MNRDPESEKVIVEVTRRAQAKTQSAQDRTRIEQAETQIEQEKTRAAQAATQTQQTNTRSIEQALRTSELSYRRLFEAAQDGILILDVDTGRITDVNPFMVNLLGYSHGEMVGKTVGELSPFHDIVCNQAMLEQLQKDGYVRYEDLPLKTKDRRHIAVEFVSNIYQAGDKKVIQCNIRDITKRKQAEATSNLLRAIVESSDDAIYAEDLNNIITSWNQGAERIFGYAASEVIGTSILRLIPAAAQDEEQQILEKIKVGEKVAHIDTLRQTKGGRWIDVSITASAIKDASGKIVGVSKAARDISERKRAATALLESKRFLQSTLNALSSHIAILDENGTIIEVNAAWDCFARENQFLGNHGRGENYLQVCHSSAGHFCEEGPAVFNGITAVMTGQQDEFHLEYPCHSPLERRWFIVRATRFGGDGPVRVVVAHENITERKLAEEQLLWKTTQLEAQLESSIDGILFVDNHGKQVLQNRRMVEIWKIPPQIVAAKDEAAQLVFVTNQTKNPKAFIERVTYLYAHPEEVGHEEIEMTDGTILDRHSSPICDGGGKHYGRIWSFRDITERRKLENAFLQAQKMESIGQLAGGIAHDFNNILAATVGSLHLAKLDAAEHPAILESLENISDATQRATDLVRQILTFSRQTNPERTAVKLSEVVMEAVKLLRSSVPATIRIQIELAEVPTVLANATAIHQVMMNLGTNAWHAMRDQIGLLKIEMRTLEVDEDFVKARPDLRPGRYVQLSVSDTGCGMDRATLEHIFEPFFTTKGVGEGTGLGLAVVHGIMKSHDGGISVYSQPGEGTTFHLYFPVIETEVVAEKIEATPIPRGQGEHILFVDDETVLAKLGKKMLERLGYVVTTQTNPLEAVTAVRGQPGEFDLVITDLTMPGMDGAKLGAQLLLLEPHLPIILATGYSGVLTTEKAQALGFREILSKPSTARTLGETVHRVLRQTAPPKHECTKPGQPHL